MYVKIYKCKMCGEEKEQEVVNKVIADVEVLKKGCDKQRHFCKNGDIGIFEIIGYKKI